MVESSKLAPSGGEHILVNSYGWKLFDWIPLASGNAAEDASCGTVFFRDDVTPEKLQAVLMRTAGGRTIESPVFTTYDTVMTTVLGLPIPYLFTYKEISLSGVVK